MPPLRLAFLEDVALHPYSTTTDVRRRVDKPRTTLDRQPQSLHMLGLLACDEPVEFPDVKVGDMRWRYSLAPHIDPDVLIRPGHVSPGK